MLKGIKSVIFDIGGVLVDLDIDRCIDSFEKIGFRGAERLVSCYHPQAIFGALERGEVSIDEFCDEIRHEAACDLSNEAICRAYCSLLIGIPIEKLRLLKRLKESGYKLYALSNMSEVMLPEVLKMFEADGMTAEYYFDDMFISYQLGVMKPTPRIYEIILERTGVNPSEMLFIDDAEKNIAAAREFGMMVYLAEARENFDHLFEKI